MPQSRLVARLSSGALAHGKRAVKIAFNHRGQRQLLLRQYVFDLMGTVSPSVAVERSGIRYYVATEDKGLGRHTFCAGSYEQDLMAQCLSMVEQGAGQPPLDGRTFVDVGANIGTSTIPAIKVFGAKNAIAFEPAPSTFRLLRCNLTANGLEERVRTFPLALSDRSGTAQLEVAGDCWSDNRVRLSPGEPDGDFHEGSRATLEVELARFDDVVCDEGIELDRIGLVWMDTQGHEGHVLAGASQLLTSHIPVVIEYWPYGLRRAQGLDLLHEILAEHYHRVIDVRASVRAGILVEVRGDEAHGLERIYRGHAYTDLIILKR